MNTKADACGTVFNIFFSESMSTNFAQCASQIPVEEFFFHLGKLHMQMKNKSHYVGSKHSALSTKFKPHKKHLVFSLIGKATTLYLF